MGYLLFSRSKACCRLHAVDDDSIPSAENGWEKHWAKNHTPWDAGASAPALEALMKSSRWNDKKHSGRALIPGCGRGYDVATLARYGWEAWGVDLAPSLKPHFEQLMAQQPRELAGRCHLVLDDFFASKVNGLPEAFDLIWDYTFLCAIPRERRMDWKRQVLRRLAPDGTLVTLLFPVIEGADLTVGPPYPLDPAEIESLLRPELQLVELKAVDKSHPGREGKEWIALWKRIP